ncbi:unannotated protein [freshwater metagenome]|uniref:Unannotated protein n=1 Tax=freshwater metagenome TaxID=449393 RepID=A0A6J6Z4L0_9ZZZZ
MIKTLVTTTSQDSLLETERIPIPSRRFFPNPIWTSLPNSRSSASTLTTSAVSPSRTKSPLRAPCTAISCCICSISSGLIWLSLSNQVRGRARWRALSYLAHQAGHQLTQQIQSSRDLRKLELIPHRRGCQVESQHVRQQE